MSAAIFGSTGLVGSNILSTLLATETYAQVTTVTRRAPKPTSPLLNAIIDADTTKWAPILAGLAPAPQTVFSGLGTTRSKAGGLANQWKIDHDLNVEVAQAAKQAGARTFVFISSAGAGGLFSNYFPYTKMKNGVESTIKELDFEHAVVLRPGVIIGERENGDFGQTMLNRPLRLLNHVGLQDALGQEAEVIARAAAHAAQLAEQGKAPSKFWVLGPADIIRLGRTEWKGKEEVETKQ